MKIALIVIGALIAAAGLVPLIRQPHWCIRGFDFPRLQFAIAGALVLAVFLSQLSGEPTDYLFVAVMIGAVGMQVRRILPFTRLHNVQALTAAADAPDDAVSFVVANVLMTNRRSRDLLRIIEKWNPDIVLTLESDAWWQEQLTPLEVSHPHRVECPLDNLYGMHLYSKLALEDPEIRHIIEDGVPSIHATVILRSAHRFTLHCMHPAPPSPTENSEATERDGELLTVGKEIAQRDGSAVVTGDLNDVAWSDTTRLFCRISGLLDPRVGRGLFNTFNARYWFVRWPLDYLFHSNDFTLRQIQRLPDFGSDHFPIFVRLQHSPAAADGQDQPGADRTDKARANRKIRAARERSDSDG